MNRVELRILYRDGNVSKLRCIVNKWKFQDSMMGEQYLTFTITSENPIDWVVGDYCIFRGETYTLNYVPSVTQKAGTKEMQDAYTYENVKFESYQEELTRCLMLDITASTGDYVAALGTNYTGSSKFSLFCGEVVVVQQQTQRVLTAVCALAAKMQANLDRMYGSNTWTISVDTEHTYINSTGDEVLVTHTEDKVLSFDNTTVAKALAEVHNTFDLNYCVRGRLIQIGYSLKNLTSDDDEKTYSFGYGKGYPSQDYMNCGLFQIKRIANSQQQIVTRLRAMGSTKNMPYRYYNNTYGLSQSLFPTNLQLPDTFESPETKAANNLIRKDTYGVDPITNLPYLRYVKGDTNDAYIDKGDDAASCLEGIREESVRFDGGNGDLPEIYPTIEEATYGELRGAGVPDQDGNTGNAAFPNYSSDERIDKLLAIGYLDGSTLVDDANQGDGILPESGMSVADSHFHVFVQDMGFDFEACWSDDTPVVSMKSGRCVGREFEILEDVQKVTCSGKKGYMLRLKRAEDSSLNTYYPNQNDTIVAGDTFVLLGIQMPGAYVKAAEVRLLRAATQFLADNCETKFTYQPSLDDIFLQRNLDNCRAANKEEESIFWRLYAGLKFTFRSVPFSEDSPAPLADITIEKVTISMGEGLTPKVELTLNDDVQQGTIQKLATSVDRIYNGSVFNSGISGSSSMGGMIAALLSLIQSEGKRLFLSRKVDDSAGGKIEFAAGMSVGSGSTNGITSAGDATLNDINAHDITGNDATLESLVIRLIQTPGFMEAVGMIGRGFGLATDVDGKSTLQTDDLVVLGRMIVNTLNIREVSYIGGTYLLTPAGSSITGVVPLTCADGDEQDTREWTPRYDGVVPDGEVIAGYRLLVKADDGTTGTMNYWHQGDQAFCETFNITEPGEYHDVSNHRWWRLVTNSGTLTENELGDDNDYHFVDVADTDIVYLFDSNGDPVESVGGTTSFSGREDDNGTVPSIGDKFVCLGSQVDTDRQGAIQITAEGTASIGIYDGINNYDLASHQIHHFSKEKVIMSSRKFEWTTASGDSVPPTVYMGDWYAGAVSSWGNEWTYNGVRWTCILENGTTTEAPGTTPANWKVVTGAKGDKGDKGDSSVEYLIEFSQDSVTIPAGASSVQLSCTASFFKKIGAESATAYSCYSKIYYRSGNTYTVVTSTGDSTAATSRQFSCNPTASYDAIVVIIGDSDRIAYNSSGILARKELYINKHGDSGLSISMIPDTIIINQDPVTNGFPKDANNAIGVSDLRILEGGVVKNTGTLTKIGESHCSATVSGTQLRITAIGTDNQNNYYHEGYVDVGVGYGGNTYTVRVYVKVNLLGTFRTVIEQDVETSVAKKISHGYDPTDQTELTLANVGQYMRSSEENSSRITSLEEKTKSNLLSNYVRDWWAPTGGTITYDDEYEGVANGATSFLGSPVVPVTQGKTYCFSFYASQNPAGKVKYCFGNDVSSVKSVLSIGTGATDASMSADSSSFDVGSVTVSRSYFTFTPASDGYFGMRYLDTNTRVLYSPRLVEGTVPTTLLVNESELKQRADGIWLSVNKNSGDIRSIITQLADKITLEILQQEVLKAGITLGATEAESYIHMLADKFQLTDVGGNIVLGVDTITKQLVMEGTIKATNFFQRICFFDGDNYSNPTYRFEDNPLMGEDYDNFVDGEYYTIEEIRALSGGHIDNPETGFVASTGNADIVLSFFSGPDEDNTDSYRNRVNLPNPDKYEGKVVRLYSYNIGQYDGAEYEIHVDNDAAQFGIVTTLYEDGTIDFNRQSGMTTVTVPIGGSVEFISTKLHTPINGHTHIWVLLENRSGGDINIEGGGVIPSDDTTYTFAEGDMDGYIKVTPSNAAAQNVPVKGYNRAYLNDGKSGMGKVHLNKNIVTVGGVQKNVLTQQMLPSTDTIYVLSYDYDLDGIGQKTLNFTSAQQAALKTPEWAAYEQYVNDTDPEHAEKKASTKAAFEAIGSQKFYYMVSVPMEAHSALYLYGRLIQLSDAAGTSQVSLANNKIYVEQAQTVYLGCLEGGYTLKYVKYLDIPSGSVLEFDGGSVKNGGLELDGTVFDGQVKMASDMECYGICGNETACQSWFEDNDVDAWHKFINDVSGPVNYEYEKGVYDSTVSVIKDVDAEININGNGAEIHFSNLTAIGSSRYCMYLRPTDQSITTYRLQAGEYDGVSYADIAVRGDHSVMLTSVEGLSLRDHLCIQDTTPSSFSFERDYIQGEYVDIVDIKGNVVVFGNNLLGQYLHPAGVRVQKFHTFSGSVRDLTIYVTDCHAANNNGLHIRRGFNILLDNVKVYDGTFFCIQLEQTQLALVNNCVGESADDQGLNIGQYGYSAVDCQSVIVEGGKYKGWYHGIAHGGHYNADLSIVNRDIELRNTITRGLGDAQGLRGINFHANAENVRIIGCRSSGITGSGRYNTIRDCVVSGIISISPSVSFSHTIENNKVGGEILVSIGSIRTGVDGNWYSDTGIERLVIRNNMVNGYLYLNRGNLANYPNSANVVFDIEGNTIENTSFSIRPCTNITDVIEQSVYVEYGTVPADCGSVRLVNNIITGCSGTLIGKNLLIENNTVKDTSLQIAFYDCCIRGNTFDGASFSVNRNAENTSETGALRIIDNVVVSGSLLSFRRTSSWKNIYFLKDVIVEGNVMYPGTENNTILNVDNTTPDACLYVRNNKFLNTRQVRMATGSTFYERHNLTGNYYITKRFDVASSINYITGNKGTFDEKPDLNILEPGYAYTCTDLNRMIYVSYDKYEVAVDVTRTESEEIQNGFAEGTRILVRTTNNNFVIRFKGTSSGVIEYPVDNETRSVFFNTPDPAKYPTIEVYFQGSSAIIVGTATFYSGRWVESDGAAANVRRNGTSSQRPNGGDIYVGFEYFDTSLGAAVHAKAIVGASVTWVRGEGAAAVQPAINTVLAGPASGSAGNPSFRQLVFADVNNIRELMQKKVYYVHTPLPNGESSGGFFKVRINQDKAMLAFKVRLYESYRYYDITICGLDQDENFWYSPKAMLSVSSESGIEVRFGYNAVNELWVAFPAYRFMGMAVSDVVYAKIEQPKSVNELFTISYEAELTGTVQTTVTANYTVKSLAAALAGTDLSLVTTGEKYEWNSKQGAIDGNTALTVKSLAVPGTSGNAVFVDKDGLTLTGGITAGNAVTAAGFKVTGANDSSVLTAGGGTKALAAANGIATLDASGKVPSSQMYSYVDDVIDGYYNSTDGKFYANKSGSTYSNPITGETGKIYVNLNNDKTYRWSGSVYIEISSSDVTAIKIGTSDTAYTPTGGIITLPAYEPGAQVHIAPTAAEVKSALGATTSADGSKFLNEKGSWVAALLAGTGLAGKSIVGNVTSGSGSYDDVTVNLSVSSGHAALDYAAANHRHDSLYQAKLATGTAGQVLVSAGASAPVWKTGELIHYVTGITGTAAKTSSPYNAATWAGTCDGVTALYTGLTVQVKVPVAGNGSYGTVLNINEWGNHPVVANVNTMVSTRYAVGCIITLIYDAEQAANVYQNSASASSITGCWKIADYDTVNIYQLRHTQGCYVAYAAVKSYVLFLQKNETTLLPVNSVGGTGTDKTLTTESFNPFGCILYYGSTTEVAAGGNIALWALYQQVSIDFRRSFNTGTTLTTNKDVYLVADLQSDGMAKLASSPIAQELPSTEDGKLYIYLGHAYNTYCIELHPVHPIYWRKNGKIQLFTGIDPDNMVVGTLTAASIGGASGDFDHLSVEGASVATQTWAKDYIVSRGENLVTNGFGSLRSNYNFSSCQFDGADTMGAAGSFKIEVSGTASGVLITDELIPVDISQSYRLSYFVKNTTNTSTYDFLDMYDIDGKRIQAGNVTLTGGTTTTLARELKNGDTVVYLTDASQWLVQAPATGGDNYRRGLIFWNYKNADGYQYPAEYYSQNWWFGLWDDSRTAINKTNNTIMLKVAWNHGTFPAGTSVSQSGPSGSYVYGNSNYIPTQNVWTKKTAVYTPAMFRNGTAYVKIGFLHNYSKQQGNIFRICSVCLTQQPSLSDLNDMATKTWVGQQDYATSSAIPTKVSDLTNDSGYLTADEVGQFITISDLTWANISGKPTTFNPATHSHDVFSATAAGFAPAASSPNKETAETAVSNYYLCADRKYRQLPANAFKNDDTKNTAGTNNKANTKMFLVGATTQAANPTTYSNVNCYIGTDNCLYSGGAKVLTSYTEQYTGTVKGVSMNNGSPSNPDANGIVDLGTVLREIPKATASVLGGVKVGSGLSIDANGVLSATGVTSMGEAFLTWGGQNLAGDFSPTDAAMIADLGANRAAFMPAVCSTFEYSRDGGTSWTAYPGATDEKKTGFFSGIQNGFTCGYCQTTDGTGPVVGYQLRVTVDAYADPNHYLYTSLRKFAIYVSIGRCKNPWCTIQIRTTSNHANNRDTWLTIANKVELGGDGYNVINTSDFRIYHSSYYRDIRFIFGYDDVNDTATSSWVGLDIRKIFFFGGMGWTTPSNMAKMGHLYDYDASQNATFPAKVTATQFVKSGGTSSQILMADGSVKTTTDILSGYATQTWVGQQGYAKSNAIPTKVSDLTNDSGYLTADDVGQFITSEDLTWSNISGKPTTFTPATHSHDVFSASAAGFAPAASSTNKVTAETAVGNYYLCADGKYRQLPANAFVGGGGGSYTLPPATASTLGGIKVGTNLSVNASGVLSIPSYPEAYLSWGGKNLANDYSPIDAAMVGELGANRSAFLPAACSTFEYSRNGGTTWTAFTGVADDAKIGFFSGIKNEFVCGNCKASDGTGPVVGYQLRVTVDTYADTSHYIDTQLRKFVFYARMARCTNAWCTVQIRTAANHTSGTDTWLTIADKVSISGDGYNVINTSPYRMYNSSYYRDIRFIFGYDGVLATATSAYVGLSIRKLFLFGGMGYTSPSNMASNGHLYAYDASQNATFPAKVTATQFVREGGTATQMLMADGSAKELEWYYRQLTTEGNVTFGIIQPTDNSCIIQIPGVHPTGAYSLLAAGDLRTNADVSAAGKVVAGGDCFVNGSLVVQTSNYRFNAAVDNADGGTLAFTTTGTKAGSRYAFDKPVYATSFNQTSDERMKTVLGNVSLSVEEIATAPAVMFQWKDGDGEQHAGTLAQYWKEVLPQVVSKTDSGMLSLDYATAAMMSAIMLARRVRELEDELKRIRQTIN